MAANRTGNRPERVKNLREQPTIPAVPMAHLWHSNSKLVSHKYSRIQLSITQKKGVFQLRSAGGWSTPRAACCRRGQSPAPAEQRPPASSTTQPPHTPPAPGPCRSCLRPDDTESGCSQTKVSAGPPGSCSSSKPRADHPASRNSAEQLRLILT